MSDDLLFIITFVFKAFINVIPILLISVILTVYVNNSNISGKLMKHLQKSPVKAVLIATFIGAFSPLCSCGVIPVIASLLAIGTPLGPVMAFWLASPSIDPEIIFINASMLGWEITLWRLFGTIILSLSAGFITYYLTKKSFISKAEIVKSSCCGSNTNEQNTKSDEKKCGCNSSKQKEKTLLEKIFNKQNLFSFGKTSLWILKLLLIAYFIEALMLRYIPSNLIYSLLGEGNSLSVVWAAMVGIPFYTSSLPALGITSGLLGQGMSVGAALSFLIAGPTTTLPAMAAVYKITSKKVFFLYFAYTFLGAIIIGYLYNLVASF